MMIFSVSLCLCASCLCGEAALRRIQNLERRAIHRSHASHDGSGRVWRATVFAWLDTATGEVQERCSRCDESAFLHITTQQ